MNRVSQCKMIRNQDSSKEKINEFETARGQDLHVQVQFPMKNTEEKKGTAKGC